MLLAAEQVLAQQIEGSAASEQNMRGPSLAKESLAYAACSRVRLTAFPA